MDEARAETKAEASKSAATSSINQDPKSEVSDSLATASALAALQSDVQPVGHDYVEEVSFHMSVYAVVWVYVYIINRNTFSS